MSTNSADQELAQKNSEAEIEELRTKYRESRGYADMENH